MTWYMIGSIGEDTQKVPRANVKVHLARKLCFERRDHHGHNTIDGLREGIRSIFNIKDQDYLLHNSETVRVVAMEDIGAHKREHWHDVVQDRFGCQARQSGHEEESLVESLRVFGNCMNRAQWVKILGR